MPTFNCTQFISIPEGRNGWSESWFRDEDDYPNAMAALDELSKKRLKLLGRDCVLDFQRVSRVDITGDAAVKAVGSKGTAGSAAADLKSDMGWTGALVRIEAGDGARRMQVFRGFPDDWVSGLRKSNFDATPAALEALNGMKDELLNGWQLKQLDKGAGNPLKAITAIVNDPLNSQLKVTVPNHGLQQGQTITFFGVKSVPVVTGRHRVFPVSENEFLVPTWNTPIFGYGGVGYIRELIYTYPEISSFQVIGKGTRKPGRPFGVAAGLRPRC